MIRTVVVLLCLLAPAMAAGGDDKTFKTQIAACKSTVCHVVAAELYVQIHTMTLDLDRHPLTEVEKGQFRMAIERVSAQLGDREFFSMIDSGRWDKLSPTEKFKWEERWGSPP